MEKKDKKSGGKKKIIIIVIIALIIIGVGGYFGYTKFLAKPNQPATAQTVQQVVQQPANQTTTPQQNSTAVNMPTVVSDKTFGLDEVLVNLADEEGKSYVKIKVFIGYQTNKKLDKELEEKKPILRDTVISVLRAKKSVDLNKSTDNIKIEILNRINPLLKEGQANNIYFNDILIQK